MKKGVQKIFLGLFCLMLMLTTNAYASGGVKFGIQANKVVFRLSNFESSAQNYKLLFFAEAQFQDERVWICIDERRFDQESLYIAGREGIENVPAAEQIAAKLFEESDGKWTVGCELEESRHKFSVPSYEVKIAETNRQDELQEAQMYILMEEDKTILPLLLAENLYGFHIDLCEDGAVLEDAGSLFSEEPRLFVNSFTNGNGLEIELCDVAFIEPQTEMETESVDAKHIAEAETMSETETAEETEAEAMLETETLAKAESESMSEMETSAEVESESMSEVETSAEAESEIIAETESETTVAIVTEAVTTESESVTEKEIVAESETVTEVVIENGASSKNWMPIILATVFLVAAIIIFGVTKVKSRKRPKQMETMEFPENNGEGEEDTLDPIEAPIKSVQKLLIHGVVANNKGRVRKNNEDNFYLNGVYMKREKMDEGAFLTSSSQDVVQLYAVCDGMGGTDCGEDASYAAVQGLSVRKAEHAEMMDAQMLTASLRTISDEIYAKAKRKGQKSGTTIVMMLIKGQKAVFANVGDSRIYRFRNKKLSQISVDHSKVQRMISMGLLTPEQAKKDPSRHVITQYLGMSSDIKVSPYIVRENELCHDDTYLLCSDGLTDMVEDMQIEEILNKHAGLQDAADALVKMALANGGRDNVTVMLLRVINTEANRKNFFAGNRGRKTDSKW